MGICCAITLQTGEISLALDTNTKKQLIAAQKQDVSEWLELYNQSRLAIGKKIIAIDLDSYTHIDKPLHVLIDAYRRHCDEKTADINERNEMLRRKLATLALMMDDWEPSFGLVNKDIQPAAQPEQEEITNQKARDWNKI